MELKGLQRRQRALQVGAAAYSHQHTVLCFWPGLQSLPFDLHGGTARSANHDFCISMLKCSNKHSVLLSSKVPRPLEGQVCLHSVDCCCQQAPACQADWHDWGKHTP